MPTAAQYAAATAAVLKVVQADIAKEMASMVFKPSIPQGLVNQFAEDAAKAALDSFVPDQPSAA